MFNLTFLSGLLLRGWMLYTIWKAHCFARFYYEYSKIRT